MEKIPLREILAAIDTGSKEIWDEFSDEQKKNVSFWLLNRYASSIAGDFEEDPKQIKELVLLRTNKFYNKNWKEVSKHPKLMWQLLCLICKGINLKITSKNKKVQYPHHPWIGFKHRENNSKHKKFLLDKFPNKKLDEIELILQLSDKKQLEKYIKEHDFD